MRCGPAAQGRPLEEIRPMNVRLDGRMAPVTSAEGLGRGCALALAEAGAEVVVNDSASYAQCALRLGFSYSIDSLTNEKVSYAYEQIARASAQQPT
jgi:2-deoxy-D-gluconate 3-dehydrogenase